MKKLISLSTLIFCILIFCSANTFTQNSHVENEKKIIFEVMKETGYFLVHHSEGKIKNKKFLESKIFTLNYGQKIFIAAIIEDCNQCNASVKFIPYSRVYKPWNYQDLKTVKSYTNEGNFTVLKMSQKFMKFRQSSTGTVALFNHSNQKRKVHLLVFMKN